MIFQKAPAPGIRELFLKPLNTAALSGVDRAALAEHNPQVGLNAAKPNNETFPEVGFLQGTTSVPYRENGTDAI